MTARGLGTAPFPVAGQNLALTLDLTTHQLVTDSSNGWSAALPLTGQSTAELCHRITALLAGASIELLLGYLRSLQAHGARLMV